MEFLILNSVSLVAGSWMQAAYECVFYGARLIQTISQTKGIIEMSLINCKDCGKEISSDAKKCIHCGANLKSISLGKLFLFILILIVVIILLIPAISMLREIEEAEKDREMIHGRTRNTIDRWMGSYGQTSDSQLTKMQLEVKAWINKLIAEDDILSESGYICSSVHLYKKTPIEFQGYAIIDNSLGDFVNRISVVVNQTHDGLIFETSFATLLRHFNRSNEHNNKQDINYSLEML